MFGIKTLILKWVFYVAHFIRKISQLNYEKRYRLSFYTFFEYVTQSNTFLWCSTEWKLGNLNAPTFQEFEKLRKNSLISRKVKMNFLFLHYECPEPWEFMQKIQISPQVRYLSEILQKILSWKPTQINFDWKFSKSVSNKLD